MNGTVLQKAGWILTLARNSLVVIFGISLAYILNINGLKPFTLTASKLLKKNTIYFFKFVSTKLKIINKIFH